MRENLLNIISTVSQEIVKSKRLILLENIEWMHEKALRNQQLLQLQRFYMDRTACVRYLPSPYPVRPASKYHFETIGGVHQHSNSTQEL